jgi:hypothetical protein
MTEDADFLEGPRAHAAVARALGRQFIVPDVGTRLGPGTIEFDLRRRGVDPREDALPYRVRLEGGVLYGSFAAAEVGGGHPC